MTRGIVSPVSKFEIPTVMILFGLIMVAIGLQMSMIVSVLGLMLIIIGSIRVLRERDKNLRDEFAKEEVHTLPENLDWESHHHRMKVSKNY